MSEEIAVIAEVAEGRTAPVVRELIAFARALRVDTAGRIRLLVPGRGIENIVGELAAIPGVAVTGIEGGATGRLQCRGLETRPGAPPRGAETPPHPHRP